MTNKTIEIASKEAEILILGRMINSQEDRKIACNLLREEHFFYREHRILFQALLNLEGQNKPAEVQLLVEELKDKQLLSKTLGVDGIMGISLSASSPIHIEHYVEILLKNWAKREALEEINKFGAEVVETDDLASFLDRFTQRFQKISKHLTSSDITSVIEISRGGKDSSYLKSLEYRKEYFRKYGKPFIDGQSTGYLELDETIGGFGNSNLIILASRPGMGKTALALNFAVRIGRNSPVGIISLEMSSHQLYERILSMESGVAGDVIREGRASDEEWRSIETTEPKISKLPLYIHEGSCFINELVTKIRQLKEDKGVKLVIIDYLQLIQAKGETRLMEISNITRSLKNLALELHIPILCLAQLSRKVEERMNHRPMLSDLRESGSIEQDADVVCFLLRPDYYDENERKGETDIIVAKNRHGRTGDLTLYFSKKFAKFNSISNEVSNDRF